MPHGAAQQFRLHGRCCLQHWAVTAWLLRVLLQTSVACGCSCPLHTHMRALTHVRMCVHVLYEQTHVKSSLPHACVSVLHACVCLCACASMHARVHACATVCMHVCAWFCVRMSVCFGPECVRVSRMCARCLRVCACVCMPAQVLQARACARQCAHARVRACVCKDVCMFNMCVYTCVQSGSLGSCVWPASWVSLPLVT